MKTTSFIYNLLFNRRKKNNKNKNDSQLKNGHLSKTTTNGPVMRNKFNLSSSSSNSNINNKNRSSIQQHQHQQLNQNSISAVYKLLLIGNSGVGKTSLINRFCDNTYLPVYIDTIGVDFKMKLVTLKNDLYLNDNRNSFAKRRSASFHDNLSKQYVNIKLQIWDTAGAARFFTITKNYYRGANGILVVYDVSDRKSFESIKTWMKSISDNATDDVEIYLIANKCDIGNLVDYTNTSVMPPQRQVSRYEGETLASIYGLKYVETSAKSNINIDRAFMDITRDIKLKIDRRMENASDSMYRTYSQLSLNNRNSIDLATLRRNEFKRKSELNFGKIKKLNRQSLLACFKF